ncbi:LacI family DNA-binding transcriptional regulator [Actinoplanes sp. Pm04-4]|uniref:LacI family DNA-binding transcriptional regulator n=1 Tax=Paractinoplanes pyxinae TaxID=2997416 RepID=A0ABT4BB79_9ACTN|nr:LacI family DNA-binding transcriptional regulator [Actinoplanes pyxinae]MCY1143756.1 LacI family DNA-binding transcriptional regulator [Actinoplanes pyxinae]
MAWPSIEQHFSKLGGKTMSTGKLTLTAIAREANVAVSTVSKVLNGHTDVSPSTRRTIERLLADRGYQRPRGARRPGRRTDLIDLVINQLDSVWGLSILTGVEEVIEEAGLSLVVSSVHNRQSLTRRWLESLLARGSAGAILVLSELTAQQRDDLGRRNLPFVVVDGVSQPPPDVPSIGATNFTGGYAATEHLIQLGHRRIAAIGGPEQLQCTRARIAGYRAALDSFGQPYDRSLVRYSNFQHDGGLRAAGELLGRPERPTAVFAGSDQQATGVYEAARRAGLSIPGDVSVVGFDGLNFAEWTAPPLTTVRQPLHEMGVAATRTLLRLINGERLESTRIELATELVVRNSTAPPSGPFA